MIVDDGTRLSFTSARLQDHGHPRRPVDRPEHADGTDALTSRQRDGDVIFHESFHDFGPAAWNLNAKIRFATTFITHNGEVQVDHGIYNDMPPDGC